MPGPQPRRAFQQRLGSAARRGAYTPPGVPGVYRVPRRAVSVLANDPGLAAAAPNPWIVPDAVHAGGGGSAGGRCFYTTHNSTTELRVFDAGPVGSGPIQQYFPDGFAANSGEATLFRITPDPLDYDAVGLSPTDVLGVTPPVGSTGHEWQTTGDVVGVRFFDVTDSTDFFVSTSQRSGGAVTEPAVDGSLRIALLDEADLTLGAPYNSGTETNRQDATSPPALSSLSWTTLTTLSVASGPSGGSQSADVSGEWDLDLPGTGTYYLVVDVISSWETSGITDPLIRVDLEFTGISYPYKLWTVPPYRWTY